MTHDELRELIARAMRARIIDLAGHIVCADGVDDPTGRELAIVDAILSALTTAGLAIVPVEATEAMLASVLPTTDRSPTDDDKRVAAGAVLILSGCRDIPNEGEMVREAALMRIDYRKFIAASPFTKETGR